ncbi:MAG: twin-arginine translocase subunit TatC [Gammaproteobacteria bacterium]|nr:MAG: twin-arginine translocase subunit TatC [Gammaproteobacteria bacterium]
MQSNDEILEKEQSFISHLLELRTRLMRAVIAVMVVFAVAFPFANKLYALLAKPLLATMPDGATMIATEVASPFLTPLKVTFFFAFVVAIPVVLYQLWAFVAPGLYQNEKRLIMPVVAASVVLFFMGGLFAYFVVFPMIFSFFQATAPEGVAVMTDIQAYLNFVIKLFLAFGFAFEVPIFTMLVIKMGFATRESLAKKRPYIFVGAFVAGMLLTPPDIISQAMLAIPIWLLFELGLFLSSFVGSKTDKDETADDMDDEAAEKELKSGIAELESLDKKLE